MNFQPRPNSLCEKSFDLATSTSAYPTHFETAGPHSASTPKFWVSSWFGSIRRLISELNHLLTCGPETLQNPCCVTHLGFRGPCVARVSRGLLRLTDQKVGGSSPSGRATETLAAQGFLSLAISELADIARNCWSRCWSSDRFRAALRISSFRSSNRRPEGWTPFALGTVTCRKRFGASTRCDRIADVWAWAASCGVGYLRHRFRRRGPRNRVWPVQALGT